MKLLRIKQNPGGKAHVEVVLESNSIDELKAAGEMQIERKGVEGLKWNDRTPPTMGDRKFADRKMRFTLAISELEYFVIEN